MSAQLTIIDAGEATLLEIAALAQSRGLVLIERNGETKLCPPSLVPEGWHRSAVRVKAAAQTQV